MTSKIYYVFVLVLTLALLYCQDNEQPRIENLNQSQWEYARGFEKTWLTAGIPGAKSISLPANLSALPEFKDYKGWITIQKRLPLNIAQRIRNKENLAIDSGMVSDVTAFYLNEKRIGKLGNVKPYVSAFRYRMVENLPFIEETSEYYLTVALYADNFPHQVYERDFLLGRSSLIFQQYNVSEMISFVLLAIYFLLGFYYLLLAYKRPGDLYYLYIAIFCIALVATNSMQLDSKKLVVGYIAVSRQIIEHSAIALLMPSMLQFLSQLFFRRHSVVGHVYWGFALVFVLAQSIGQSFPHLRLTLLILLGFTLPGLVYAIYMVIKALLHKKDGAGYLVLGILAIATAGANDILVAMNILPPYVSYSARFGFVLFVLGIAAVLANIFTKSQNQVEYLNKNLEKEVAERTEELVETLGKINALKVAQDADYFLTTILLKPLTINKVTAQNLTVDFLIEQKKKFTFNKKDNEIGGDICIAHDLILNHDVPYSVVLNADAMGKSIQGAGGALVLGSVFQSIIERTKSREDMREHNPERWLKNVFLELHKVFLSFDGSMLISLALILIDQRTGFCYFINAEHPFIVLLRKNKTGFLRQNSYLNKAGFPLGFADIPINTFQLRDGDQLFLGSDGKDDLVIQNLDEETRIINEDETLFPRFVLQAKGNLETLKQLIQEKYELMDDFSLIRVQYRDANTFRVTKSQRLPIQKILDTGLELEKQGKFQEALDYFRANHKPSPLYADILAKMIALSFTAGDFSEVVDYIHQYTRLFPGDIRMFRVASRILMKNGNLKEGIDFAERYRIHEPQNAGNLLRLVRAYIDLGHGEKAVQLLNKIDVMENMVAGFKNQLDELHGRAEALAQKSGVP